MYQSLIVTAQKYIQEIKEVLNKNMKIISSLGDESQFQNIYSENENFYMINFDLLEENLYQQSSSELELQKISSELKHILSSFIDDRNQIIHSLKIDANQILLDKGKDISEGNQNDNQELDNDTNNSNLHMISEQEVNSIKEEFERLQMQSEDLQMKLYMSEQKLSATHQIVSTVHKTTENEYNPLFQTEEQQEIKSPQRESQRMRKIYHNNCQTSSQNSLTNSSSQWNTTSNVKLSQLMNFADDKRYSTHEFKNCESPSSTTSSVLYSARKSFSEKKQNHLFRGYSQNNSPQRVVADLSFQDQLQQSFYDQKKENEFATLQNFDKGYSINFDSIKNYNKQMLLAYVHNLQGKIRKQKQQQQYQFLKFQKKLLSLNKIIDELKIQKEDLEFENSFLKQQFSSVNKTLKLNEIQNQEDSQHEINTSSNSNKDATIDYNSNTIHQNKLSKYHLHFGSQALPAIIEREDMKGESSSIASIHQQQKQSTEYGKQEKCEEKFNQQRINNHSKVEGSSSGGLMNESLLKLKVNEIEESTQKKQKLKLINHKLKILEKVWSLNQPQNQNSLKEKSKDFLNLNSSNC